MTFAEAHRHLSWAFRTLGEDILIALPFPRLRAVGLEARARRVEGMFRAAGDLDYGGYRCQLVSHGKRRYPASSLRPLTLREHADMLVAELRAEAYMLRHP